ncbi:hypothetical protein QBC41DRAFT_223131 [Cercophora samala]|uniref:ubiquitinyl hydrolase 1 n=1 Tax=Cercophora samala TaxID=330535 RepID=A0AA39ZEU4_9PEZI|nr:hypothetical protein QBC41DRAFT_223131 [Cercophora samala]
MGPKRATSGNQPKETGSTAQNPLDVDRYHLRRSTRVTKKPRYLGQNEQESEPANTKKRKATPVLDEPESTQNQEEQDLQPELESESELELEDPVLPEHVTKDIIAASLEPWKEDELEEWNGWAEVASDPVLFTDILVKLGLEGAKIEEVLALDELAISLEPPVYGLVFLQRYESMRQVWMKSQPDKSALWFATQTATNACGTIAILNIIMNARDLSLGEKLSEFKEQSKNLSPQLRGNNVATSTFIRAAHNMHNSRLDLLDAILELEQDVLRTKKARTAKRRATSANRRRTGGATSAAYHFVAFVPVGNGIWLFDGLEDEPGFVCNIENPDNWLKDIESTLQTYTEGSGAQYNLMALCGIPQDGRKSSLVRASHQTRFSPLIHEWIKMLVDCRSLERMIES